jgi:hypothetical protein
MDRKMTEIQDWLDDRVQELIDSLGHHDAKSDFREQARALVARGEDAGYSVADLKAACGGDVEQYLLEQQNAMTDVETQQAVDDSF